MNAATNAEYRKLALDSSNDMIDHDADRTLGRYPKAAWHILQAGLARFRMAQMMLDAGNYPQAAADWLSAAACFYLATDPKRMREALDRARQLDREGKIPAERRDIHAALKEREAELKALEQKLSRFQEEYRNLSGSGHASSQESLDWLLLQVRELPGLPDLHAMIATHAARLGQNELSARHSACAEQINPACQPLEIAGGAAEGVRDGAPFVNSSDTAPPDTNDVPHPSLLPCATARHSTYSSSVGSCCSSNSPASAGSRRTCCSSRSS